MRRTGIFFILFSIVLSVSAQSPHKHNQPEKLLEGCRTIEIFDSLTNAKFFHSELFNSDKTVKPVFSGSDDYLTENDETIVRARIAEMNATSPFEYRYTPEVMAHINFYLKKREYIARVLGLTELYFPLFEEMLDKYNLPLELKYVSIIESALNPTARSRAGASGLWQFMLGTGKLYNLEVDSYVDERYDPYKATEAACRHFTDLFDIYGDWALCLAAYNAGAGRINRTLNKINNTPDYWQVQGLLPKETQNYVPAFIAASYVFKYYNKYNIKPVYPSILHTEVDSVSVRAELSFEVISKNLQIPIEIIEFLNPTYKRQLIPAPTLIAYRLRLPKNRILQFDSLELDMYLQTYKKKYPQLLANYTTQKINTADNLDLYAVAIEDSTCVSENEKSDSSSKEQLIVQVTSVSQLLEIINNPTNYLKNAVATTTTKSIAKDLHIVKSGESLGAISKKYGCSVNELMKWNNLKTQTIHPGQKLFVASKGTQKSVNSSPSTSSNNSEVTHTVKSGESLWSISNKYGVTVEQIKSINNISKKTLFVGQKLKIKG